MLTQYHVSKLLLMYVMEGIAAKTLDKDGKPEVIVTTVCPSLCRTNLGREFGLMMRISNGLFQKIFARSCEEGSRTLVSGAALGPKAHNDYWSHDVFFE